MTVVNKLGGSCLRSVDDFLKIPLITVNTPCLLVVSASYGTTETLFECLRLACTQKNYKTKLNALIDAHIEQNKKITRNKGIHDSILKDKAHILALLQSVALLKTYSEEQKSWLLGYGEYWSSQMVAGMLNAPWVDAGQIITIDLHDSIVSVDWKITKKRLQNALKEINAPVIVMPGFVARDHQGHRALLGFNGSDFTAAIMAKLLKAEAFYKWTDIDGIYTADPKLVKSAFALPEISYEEASELAYFGASVLHPQSVQPAIEANIPIYIKNFFKPSLPGTVISSSPAKTDFVVKALSLISGATLINVEGTGILGLCGFAQRLFNALSQAEISVILISQASSEHSISLVINAEHGRKALLCLEHEFEFELHNGRLQNVELIEGCAIVSAVGDGMSGTPGVAAKFFEMLGRANINILAIAQGSSQRNISVVIKDNQTQRAIRVLHGGFYLSRKTLSIGLVGPGSVGSELLDQIKKNRLRLKKEMNVDLKVRGIMNSQNMLLNDTVTEFLDWQNSLKSNSVPKNMKKFITHVTSPEIPHAVIVDCTSSSEIAAYYPEMIKKGCHLVTPNKKANSSDLEHYHLIKSLTNIYNRHYLYEATVCAGLPVIKTIQELLATGDVIKRIEGIVSGTLSYIFHRCAHGASFAESVLEAHKAGYTEHDPREDLTGLDVARKFVCLGRELGFNTTLDDVTSLDLVPEKLRHVSVAEFLKKLPAHQQEIEKKIKKLLEKNAAIAYVGVIENGKITIQLNGYKANHPFANTIGTDNILLIQSRRYDKQPLIIQGPGAGKDVTAAGVFADLIKLASML